jgi:glycosyltransferase involved in cell wall biosynthesis
MISVIIPALNEAKSNSTVITFCYANRLVDEVIIVDGHSTNATILNSISEGINAAKNQYLVFLDEDIDPYPADTMMSAEVAATILLKSMSGVKNLDAGIKHKSKIYLRGKKLINE